MTIIYPVIMCGGAGTRLWPLSRKDKPKQYHPLVTNNSMLQETILRMKTETNISVANPSFVCAVNDAALVQSQCKDIGFQPLKVILEPVARNTAPVAAIISEVFHEIDPEGLILLLPADHHIADPEAFWSYIQNGIAPALSNQLVTLGIRPTRADTGYGYIRRGTKTNSQVFDVDAFVEKPGQETAQSYLESGEYFWNAGIFLFSPLTMRDSFQKHSPEILEQCKITLFASKSNGNCLILDLETFGKCNSDSLDYSIMENARNVSMVAPVDIGWSDIGSWLELANLAQQLSDKSENQRNIFSLDCKDTYMRTDGPLIAGIGLENFIVVVENNTVLILPKNRSQDVKKVVEHLKSNGQSALC